MTLADAGVLDAVVPAARLARARDEIVFVFLVAGVDVDRDRRESHRRTLAQNVEDLKQGPAVLSAGETDHDSVAIFDHAEVDDRLRGSLCDP